MTLWDSQQGDGVMSDLGAHRMGHEFQQMAEADAEVALALRSRTLPRSVAFFAAATTMLALCACGQSDSKTYDISPIFPLSSNKCARYDGKTEGSGITTKCWVTKAKCEQAVQDWRQAMQQGGVTDAIQFRCD